MLVIFLLVTVVNFSVTSVLVLCCMELGSYSDIGTSMACDMRYRIGVRNTVRWKLADSFRQIR